MSSVQSRAAPPGRVSPGHAGRPFFENRICASRQVLRSCEVELTAAALDPGLRRSEGNKARSSRSEDTRRETMTKLQRAHDGCLGDRRRRRTWVAAKSVGEPLTRL